MARTSGVSRATVSRALNGAERVSPAVRERVLIVAEQLGYRPNSAARSLASGRSGVLGFVIPTGHVAAAPYEAHLLEQVATATSDHGHGLMLWMAAAEPTPAVRDGFRAGLVDGIVVSGVGLGSAWIDGLFDAPHPSVLVGRHPRRDDVYRIEVANRDGAAAAVAHLLAGGGQRIATIAGPSDRADSVDRQAGYEETLVAAGIGVDTRLVDRGEFTVDSGYEAMRRLLAHRPDSVFAANDLMAAGALRAIAEAGLRVPDDVAVVGFDDLPIAARTDPALTTVRQDIEAIGSSAVEVLLTLLGPEPETAPLVTTLDVSLIVRQSTRPVGNGGAG